jgi:aspartate/methionine/tyrosine aminotransferase
MVQSYDSIMMLLGRVSTEEERDEEENEAEQQRLLLHNGQHLQTKKERLEESTALLVNDDDDDDNNNNNNSNIDSHFLSKSALSHPNTTATTTTTTTAGNTSVLLLMVVAVASVVSLFLAPSGGTYQSNNHQSVESAASSSLTVISYPPLTPASATFATTAVSSSDDVLGMAHAATTTTTTTTTSTSTSTSTTTSSSSTLSERGQSLKPARDDFAAYALAVTSPYHPLDNPTGYLVMLVAENKLLYPELAARLEQTLVVAANAAKAAAAVEDVDNNNGEPLTSIPPQWVFNYGDMRGHVTFRTKLAKLMEQSWIAAPVHPESLVIQSGAGAILDSLAWILANAGDALLLTSPAYPAFSGDFAIHGQMTTYYIPTTSQNLYEPTTVEELNTVYDQAIANGHVPRILVICQPNNPTGRIYSAEAMTLMMDWALSKQNMHVVSDEIYGNSVFPGVHVTSAAEIMWNKAKKNNYHYHSHSHHKKEDKESHDDGDSSSTTTTTTSYLGDRVHVVAGLSKDWGMSGFRVGSLFTHNSELINAMGMISYYDSVSQYTQYTLSTMLGGNNDDDDDLDGWVEWYLHENQRRLQETYVACVTALERIGVTVFREAQGALFVWADFSSLLLEGQSEQELWWELFQEAHILFTTGQSCHGEKPGMFRVVYPWPEGGVVAMEELGNRLVQWKAARYGSE